MNLSTLSDAELSALVAKKVEGWTLTERPSGAVVWIRGSEWICPQDMPPYATSADAVLPLLEKMQLNGFAFYITDSHEPQSSVTGWNVEIYSDKDTPSHWYPIAEGEAPTFARAACISLLLAHGMDNM